MNNPRHKFNGLDYDRVRLTSIGSECPAVKIPKNQLIENDDVLISTEIEKPLVIAHSEERYLVVARPPQDPNPKADHLVCSLASKYVLKKARYVEFEQRPLERRPSYEEYQPRGYQPRRSQYGNRY